MAATSTSEPSQLTFQVDQVKQQRFPSSSIQDAQDAKNVMLVDGEVAEFVHLDDSLTNKPWLVTEQKHAFFNSCFSAYAYHHGVVFSADMLLQLILEGLAVHTSQYPEKLRTKFVHHEGKQEIILERDDFVPGSATNDWRGLVDEFCDEIRSRANPEVYDDLIGEAFSTTTKTDMVCRQIALMSTVKHYFKYTFVTRCGFSTVTLLGTRDDYVLLQAIIAKMGKYMMPRLAARWIPALESIMAHFVGAWDGNIDKRFWGSMCKYGSSGGGSGPSYTRVSGWINILFPYIGEQEQLNPYCVPWSALEKKVLREKDAGRSLPGPDVKEFTRRFCFAPVLWIYCGIKIPLRFKAGFVGGTFERESGVVTPQMTWAIVHPDPKQASQV